MSKRLSDRKGDIIYRPQEDESGGMGKATELWGDVKHPVFQNLASAVPAVGCGQAQ